MLSRRNFLHVSSAGAAGMAVSQNSLDAVARATASVAGQTSDAVAQDESYWREIQQAFDVDRTLINLNNGNSSPSPRVVHDAFKRYLDSANQLPVCSLKS